MSLDPSLRALLAQARQGGPWRQQLRGGDWAVLLLGAALVAASYPLLWRGAKADFAVIKRDGEIVAELALTAPRRYPVQGPLGTTLIEVQAGRARVVSDPGPRQYCVQQGWLSRANAVAICAPNHITLTLTSRDGGIDSLNY